MNTAEFELQKMKLAEADFQKDYENLMSLITEYENKKNSYVQELSSYYSKRALYFNKNLTDEQSSSVDEG